MLALRLCGFLVCVLPLSVLAESVPAVTSCEPACVFKDWLFIPEPSGAVPVVVEQPLPPALAEVGAVAVMASTSGKWLPVRVMVEQTKFPAPVRVFDASENRSLPVLSDDRADTNFTFPLRPDLTGRALLTLRADTPITVSALSLTLAPNVTTPRSVSVSVPTEAGLEEIVLAPTAPSMEGIVRFPETTAREFFVTITYNQPLRLSEIDLFEHDPRTQIEAAVRFLATPGESYYVYLRPDRAVTVSPDGEMPDLVSDEGVMALSNGTIESNPRYVPADQDADGTLDRDDNCIVEANTDQTDVDGNGLGDVCDDFDRDGLMNSKDNCSEEPNRDQRDEDSDGIGDVCDDEESRLTEQYAFIPWAGMGLAALVLLGLFAVTLRQTKVREEPPTL